MSASLATERWIYGTLASDTTLQGLIGDRIYSHIAPEDTQYPYILFQQISGTDLAVNGAYRIQTKFRYLIKVVTQGGKLSGLDGIIDRVYELLHAKQHIATPGGMIQSSIITGPYTSVESTPDSFYPIRGVFLRISA